ncbi:MAG TPA: hypothetical protein VG621_01055 [Candidatus Paceibacterota bacterium]|nr:hypothetical protein [Candidatus Paceibacterota bacterium]
MEIIEKTLLFLIDFIFFVTLSVVFLPAFLIVTALQDTWSGKMKDVFGL